MAKAEKDERLVEHRRTSFHVEVCEVFCRHSDSETGGDDRAGARAADVVEEVAETKVIALPALLAQQVFHTDENLQRQDATDTAAVECEEFARTFISVPVFQVAPKRHVKHLRSLDRIFKIYMIPSILQSCNPVKRRSHFRREAAQ